MASTHEECIKLILEKLLNIYGELHSVTMIINSKNKLSKVTKVVDSAIVQLELLISENKPDKKLCKHISTVVKMLFRLKQRINKIMQKKYKTPKGVANRLQREELATPIFDKLHDVNRDVSNIVTLVSDEKAKESFERVSVNIFLALSEVNSFVTNDPTTEALREDLYRELSSLINETHSIKIMLLGKNNNKE